MTTTAIPPTLAAPSARPAHRATTLDRLVVLLLGAAGCVLSYDALRQVAFAIHVRPALTYLFPVVIDGFIAYGVRALLVLRDAPLRARLYVWALFTTATVASTWANALHAVRLNQLPSGGGELHLGNATVGILSTLAPLALAGATHLQILITRHGRATGTHSSTPRTAVRQQATTGAAAEPEPVHEAAPSAEPVTDSRPRPQSHVVLDDVEGGTPAAAAFESGQRERAPRGRPPGGSFQELLTIARPAVGAQGRLSRRVVGQAIRAAGRTISDQRLTELMAVLRDEATKADQ